MIHLFLNSIDSINTHPNNNPFDFTIELPEALVLDGEWECALSDIYYDNSAINEELFVFSDICNDSYVYNNRLPILRKVNKPDIFTLPYFTSVNLREIQRIRIFIKDKF